MISGPVRQGTTGGMLSGPVSEWSAGSVTAGQPVTGDGAVHEGTAGAVKKDADRPIGEPISNPMSVLGNLQNRLRARLEEASGQAAEGGAAEASDRGGNQVLEGTVDESPVAAEESAAPGSEVDSEPQRTEEPAAAEDEAAPSDEKLGVTDSDEAAEDPTRRGQ
jgi:hypothetical protein